MIGTFHPQLHGQALRDCRSKMRLNGDYFEMNEPPIAGLTVESVEVHPCSLHIRFVDGSLLCVGVREGDGVDMTYLAESA